MFEMFVDPGFGHYEPSDHYTVTTDPYTSTTVPGDESWTEPGNLNSPGFDYGTPDTATGCG